MKVEFNSLGNVYSPPSKTVRQKPVSFCGADEFVQGALNPQTYKEARKALQREYLPEIARLKNEYRTLSESLTPRDIFESTQSKEAVGVFNEFMQIFKACAEKGKKENAYPHLKLATALSQMHDEVYLLYTLKTADPARCVMVVSQDKKAAEKFFDFSEFYSKVNSTTPSSQYWKEKADKWVPAFKLDFTGVKDVTGDSNGLQKATWNAAKKAEETYQKTGRKSFIQVENMERLLNHQTNPKKNIASMKELMNCISEDYHSTILFHATDPSKLDPGTMVSHRVGYRCNLDELGVKVDDFSIFDDYKKQLQPAMDKIDETIRQGEVQQKEMLSSIKRLKKEFKEKIAELNERFPKEMRNASTNLQTPTPEPEVIKKLSKTKVGLIIAAAATAFGGGILLYKKFGKKNAAPKGIPQIPAAPATTPFVSPQALMQQTPAAQPLTQYSAPLTMQDFLKQNS